MRVGELRSAGVEATCWRCIAATLVERGHLQLQPKPLKYSTLFSGGASPEESVLGGANILAGGGRDLPSGGQRRLPERSNGRPHGSRELL